MVSHVEGKLCTTWQHHWRVLEPPGPWSRGIGQPASQANAAAPEAWVPLPCTPAGGPG